MYRQHKKATPATLFTSFGQILGEQKMKRLEDKKSWDNIFREQVTFAIDEEVFSVIYSHRNGRPNAPIRILVAMLILKEGFGWSDSELYDECRFNIRVMNALGLSNASDEVPVESTYYEFQRKLYEYELKESRDLMSEASEKTTKGQAEIFSVNSKWIRMDSKLVGSNITKSTRLHLIISCLQEFYKSLDEKIKRKLKKEDQKILEELMQKKAYQIVYQSSNEQKEEYLGRFGELLSRLEKICEDKNSNDSGNKSFQGKLDEEKYSKILRLFKEQYQRNKSDGKIELKPESEIPSEAIQSPYDMDAAYRKKGDKKVRGYNLNIIETCNKGELNLLLGAEIYKANKSDTEIFEEGVKQAERICGKVEKISVDGAYHSPENQKYAKGENKEIYLSGITGAGGDYDFEQRGEKLKVINKETGEEIIAHITKKGHYRIKEKSGKRRYFTKEQIESYMIRKEVEDLPKEIRNIRCNVEASIFQSCYHLKKDKTKYRGLFRHQLWAKCRMIWINMIRIKNHINRIYLKKQKLNSVFA
jgi:Transposase domain (DUF772)/Transposase DDE domain